MSIERDLASLAQSSGGVQALDERDFTFAEDLGKYRLLGALGSGGMADVFLAVADGPEGFRKLCVVKLLKETMAEDDEYRAMFLDEARLAARLNHPHIVQTFEVGETQSRLMIVMEYIEGQPATRVRRRLTAEQFSLTSTVSILCDVLDALEYAHGLTNFDGSKLGIVHRDVSPHNIIIGYDGRAKLVDFGIAKSAAAMQQTQAGVLKGKAAYMAPEQAMMRTVDGRADVFSVGVILWEAIAGRRLADGMTTNDVLVRRIEGGDPKISDVVPDVDPALATICDRAMACDPDQRYPTAADLHLALEGWLKDRGDPSRKPLSKALREAFHAEREQLRALVEHRMGESSPNLARTGSLSFSSPRVSGAPEAPTPPHRFPQSPSVVSVAPVAPPSRRPMPGLVIAGLAVCATLGIAATVYVARSSTTQGPATGQAQGSRSEGATPSTPGAITATPAATTAPVSVTSSAPAPVVTATSGSVAGSRPTFAPPAGRPPPVGFHPPPTPVPNTGAAAVPTSATTTAIVPNAPPGRPLSRPLDEKDPYAQ